MLGVDEEEFSSIVLELREAVEAIPESDLNAFKSDLVKSINYGILQLKLEDVYKSALGRDYK